MDVYRIYSGYGKEMSNVPGCVAVSKDGKTATEPERKYDSTCRSTCEFGSSALIACVDVLSLFLLF